MHVEITPLFWARLWTSLEAMRLRLLLDILESDTFIFFQWFHEITLRQDEHDWLHCLDVLNLNFPSIHRLKRFLAVASYADHEAVGTSVLHLSVNAKMLITTCVVDLDLDLVLLDGLDSPIHIQYRGFIVFRKWIVQIVSNETRFANRCVSN